MPARRISKRIIAAIDKMITGECKNITEAAEAVGLARESLSRALSKPHVAEHLRQRVLRHLAIASARAGATKSICSTATMPWPATAPRASYWV